MGNSIEIIVCMGSACFARGNAQNLQYIEDYVSKNNLQATIEIAGSRCESRCAQGPNLVVNGVEYNGVDELKIKEIFESLSCV